jgi:hypothetical protein
MLLVYPVEEPMAEIKPPPPADTTDFEELVVSWKNPDGSIIHGRALRRQSAEEMVRIFSSMYPDQTYWLEPLAMRAREVYPGVRRKRQTSGSQP